MHVLTWKFALRFSLIIQIISITAIKSSAQTLITGKITDTTGKVIGGVTVSLLDSATNNISQYTSTKSNGKFQISINEYRSHLIIQANSIGYLKVQEKISRSKVNYDFVLKESTIFLPDVKIKDFRPHLKIRGDTLSYIVKDFSAPQDRVIGDVIKKLPGIEVDKTGKISYNGKAISNFYIDGDNVLDDKYTIGTNVIPVGVVEQVQVFEHDQPIRVLSNAIISDKVSLNITLKAEAKAKLFGQSSLGVGVPQLYDLNISGLLLKNQIKSINLLSANNDGYNLETQILSHNANDFSQTLNNFNVPQFLSAGSVQYPDVVNQNRYFFNHSVLMNTLDLKKFKDSVQLKWKFYVLDDSQQQYYRNVSTIFLKNDTIRYYEKEDNKIKPYTLHADININVNKSKFYINNTLKAEIADKGQSSSLNTNNLPVNQNLNNNLTSISNDFNYIKSYNSNQIFEVYSYLNYDNQNSRLKVDTALYPPLFKNIAYQQINQTVKLNSLYLNDYASYKLSTNSLKQSYTVGFISQLQNLQSLLYADDLNKPNNSVADSGINRLNWENYKIYGQAKYSLSASKFRFDLTIPVRNQLLYYNNIANNNNQRFNFLYIEPEVYIRLNSGKENFFTLNYNIKKVTGNVNNVYTDYLLTDYRTITTNSAILPQTSTQKIGLDFNYRKAIRIFFFHTGLLLSQDQNNLIYYSQVSDQFTFVKYIPYNNTTKNLQAFAGISKYLFEFKTGLSFKASWQYSRTNQLYNNVLLPYNNYSYNLSGNSNSKIGSNLYLDYFINFNYINNLPANIGSVPLNEAFYFLDQKLEINYNASSILFIKLNVEDMYNHNPNANDTKYIFLDGSFTYKLKKLHADLQLNILNIANIKDYKTTLFQSNLLQTNDFKLRGRTILVKAIFNF